MQNTKYKMQNAKFKMQNAKLFYLIFKYLLPKNRQ